MTPDDDGNDNDDCDDYNDYDDDDDDVKDMLQVVRHFPDLPKTCAFLHKTDAAWKTEKSNGRRARTVQLSASVPSFVTDWSSQHL